MSEPVTVQMPLELSRDLIDAIRRDPLTAIEDRDEWHARLGWLICAYEVILRERTRRHD
jgi:hypothetical protein